MTNHILDTQIEYLKGIGPKRAEILKKELGIFYYRDLLHHFPFRYVDKTKFYDIKDISSSSAYIQVKGIISNIQLIGEKKGQRLTAKLTDSTGSIELIWFKGFKYLKDKYTSGKTYIVYGKPSAFVGKYNIVHPDIEDPEENKNNIPNQFEAVYNTTEKMKNIGLNSKAIHKSMKVLLNQCFDCINENLPLSILNKYKLLNRKNSYLQIHCPTSSTLLKQAERRLKFEELFFIQLQLIQSKLFNYKKLKGVKLEKVGTYFNNFYKNCLPFELTNAQKKVIKEIRKDTNTGHHMNRLVQGDVGSGKTLVGLMAMLIAIDNGYQVCMMAPTEILANQHYNSISKFIKDLNLEIKLLTGSTKTKERRSIHENLLSGELKILIGTHALIEDTVQFNNLGMVVIDEQHRFGVSQRAKLWKKNTIPPHVLVMTATPIPRTLAMTLYGDLDVSVIDELPPGRKPIKTFHGYESKRLRVFGFIKEQIKEGRQIYIVYPLIEESEKLDLKNIMEGYDAITRAFPSPEYRVSIVHGKMKPENKDYEMDQFAKGNTQIMIATTVIEVGVDVPNATTMVIENAERFGLSQLHQLRGRVGRGGNQSYCILMSNYKLSADSKKRIEIMVDTNDGFIVANEDLKLRGPGDIEGTRQSGVLNLKIADIIKDEILIKYAREIAQEILKDDPNLTKSENSNMKQFLEQINKNKTNWSRIS
ncbi:MAG: ATP-dependent DNA helicase RecG [Hyphomicrobiales bacterium]